MVIIAFESKMKKAHLQFRDDTLRRSLASLESAIASELVEWHKLNPKNPRRLMTRERAEEKQVTQA